jgi:enoyl-CoA hydratase
MRGFLSLWDFPKPIITGVHGYCLAAGTLLAVMSDITVVTDDAQIGLPSLPLGGGFLSPTWVHLVGPKRAKLMSFDAGRRISGATAVEWGWANHAVAPDELLDELAGIAGRISRTPAGVLRMKKASINRVVELGGMRTAALWGAETDALIHQSHDLIAIEELIDKWGVAGAARHFDEFGADPKASEVGD